MAIIYNLELNEQAEYQLKEAIAWYEDQKENLGNLFLAEIKKSLVYITDNPFQYSKIYKDFRKCLTKTYPYWIFYEIVEKDAKIIVLGFFHTSRNPKNWKKLF